MRGFFESGRAIDVVLAVVALEVAALVAWRRRTGRGPGPADLVGLLGAGVLLMLAVRCALTGADYRLTAVLVTAALPVHLFDLTRRLRGDPGAASGGRPAPQTRSSIDGGVERPGPGFDSSD